VTEDEIHNGILKANAPNKHCLWFRRNINNLSDAAIDSKNISRFYIDFAADGIDTEATALLKDLKENHVEKTLDAERIIDYYVEWGAEKGIDPTSCVEHEKYMEKLCSDFQQKLTENIVQGIKEREQLDIKDPLYEEMFQHIAICQEKCEMFHGRSLELEAIKEYLNTESNQSPLVVYGQSGSGKTSLIAMAARQCKEDVGRAIVMRFLGTTQQSCNIRTVLVSLCQQIYRIYELESDTISVPEVCQL
jgi:AAA+ ATPase superfamily predicted ATPase